MDGSLSPEITAFISGVVGSNQFEVHRLAGDASTRKYFRIVFDSDAMVLMSWESFSNEKDYPFLNVQKHFERVGVRVPKVKAVEPRLGVILLEDLGDLTLERKFWENQNQEAALPFYEAAVEELAKIHFNGSRPVNPPAICQTTNFDTAKFMWEMNYAFDHFLKKVCEINLSDADQEQLMAEFLTICETLDQQPKFVCHRDYHSRNLMLKLGRLYVIDFQDARGGPLQYDLVSLIHDSYVDLSEASQAHIKLAYLNLAREVGPKGAIRDDFDRIFLLQTIQRCFKACGSFASFLNTREDTRYLKYIRPTINLVANSLTEFGDFPLFTRILADSDILTKDFEAACAR